MSDPTPYPGLPAGPAQGPAPQRRSKTKQIVIAGVVVAVLVGIGYASIREGVSTAVPATPPLVQAKDSCDPAGQGVTVADGNKTLVIDGKGEEDTTGVEVSAVACVLQHLGATTAVVEHMDSTRALDGRQSDEWPGYRAAWTYHPDQGLNIIIQTS